MPRLARIRTGFETALLLASVVTLLLPTAAGAVALAAVAALWWLGRVRDGRWVVGVGLSLSAALFLAAWLWQQLPPPSLADGVPELERGYGRLWNALTAEAGRAAEQIGAPPERGVPHRAIFEQFQQRVAETEPAGLTLLLLDPDGTAVAWAGDGVLHEPDPFTLPAAGATYRRGYTSTTLLAVVPLSEERRPWRVVAGRSLPSDRLPFDAAGTSWPAAVRWAVAPAEVAAPSGVVKLQHAEAPAMFVEVPAAPAAGAKREDLAAGLRRLGLILWGLTLFALPIVRALGRRAAGESPRWPLATPFLVIAGVLAWSSAATLTPPVTAAVSLAAGVAAWALARGRRPGGRSGGGEVAGALGLVALALLALPFQHRYGAVDLAAGFGGDNTVFALRLAWCLASLGLLLLAARRYRPAGSDRAAWLAALLLATSAAFNDQLTVALSLLALAGAALVRWLSGVDFAASPGAFGAFLVLAALAGGSGWEIAYRAALRHELARLYLPRVAPPTAEELNDLHLRLFEHFNARDLGAVMIVPAGEIDRQDLAYELWRHSPLAFHDGLSALVAQPFEGAASSFSFGLALGDDLELAPNPERWQVPATPAWQRAMILGESLLTLGGQPWGTARYWFVPRPGFRLEVSEVQELETALVGGAAARRPVDGLPRGVLYGLYRDDGEAILSPWEESPPLAPEARQPAVPRAPDSPRSPDGAATSGVVATPSGPCWYFAAAGDDSVAVLYLPVLEPLAGLERVGVHALGSLALIALAAALSLLFALPRSAFRDLAGRFVRSYSKRLILVYTVLLLVPLVTLNLFLLRGFESRLRREQLTNAQAAIGSARLFLLDYLLRLEPGFDIQTRLNRTLLQWVASVVQHQVNLYWGSRLYASSQQELFTVGLLPRRIPGDVYSRLALDGYEMGYRTRERDGVAYLEFYAPLHVPAMAPSQQGLFLSVPLLEQEAAVAGELAAMRRRAALVTTALFLLLAAVGSRLARSFTTPIMELIEGTRRIAAGAPYLGFTPREHELSALGNAIDEMARRIAEGRHQLVLEKQVVERIVENITSGVVSLDRERRVLLQNRVAAELLGSEIGAGIAAALGRDPRLQGVGAFLRRAGDAPRQETLHLVDEDGDSREWTLTWVPLAGGEDPSALLVVDDVTEVLRGQRLEAWAEMARIIAHEIKNPLTPIRLSTEHMQQVHATDPARFDTVFARCTDNILKQVEELRDIASDFSIYSRIPRAELVSGDLVAAMQELTEAYRDTGRGGVEIDLIVEETAIPARFDKKLLGRAVRNLLENALRANAGRGRVELRLERNGDAALIRVADSGPGVEPKMLRRIFEPYFSTYETGTGLGLAITRRIVEEHGGQIEARNRPEGGLEVVTTLPLAG